MPFQNESKSLKVISTGGTFEKRYDPLTGQLHFVDSHLSTLVKQARIDLPGQIPTVIQSLMLIDSLDMDSTHRQQIVHAVQSSNESQIVIVHGTDTMPETARALGAAQQNTGRAPQTIVLTGAMVPIDVTESDGFFNLGFAIACARILAPGIYVAMNAQIHSWQTVKKNRTLGIFESAKQTP
jgi:L-asparaginase